MADDEVPAGAAGWRPTLRDRLVISSVSFLAWLLLWSLGKTWRCRVLGREHYDGLVAQGQPFIFSIWHDNILAPIFVHRAQGIRPMVSHHRDGEMIARLLARFGYAPIRGSSTRGGNDAFHEMVRELSTAPCAMMPDGPRGPRHVYKPGTILIASRARARLLPMTFDARRKHVFKSWDRMKLPLPFARVIIRYGAPIEVPGMLDEDVESFRLSIESSMNALDDLATNDVARDAGG